MFKHFRYWMAVFMILAVAALLRHVDPTMVARLRMIGFDTLQQIAPRAPDATYPVRIVDVDERSIAKLGNWPWSHDIYARLVDKLGKLGARTVAFDIAFPAESEKPLALVPEALHRSDAFVSLKRRLADLPTGSEQFAKAISGMPVVLGIIGQKSAVKDVPAAAAGFTTIGRNVERFVPAFPGATGNATALNESAAGAGALNWFPEHDQILRRVPMLVRIKDKLYPSLAAETLRVATGAKTIALRSAAADGGADTGIAALRVGQTTVPTDGDGQLWLSFSASDPKRFVSVIDVLEGRVTREQIEGRIILVGTSAPGLFDLRATPLDPVTAGVEVHAQALELLLKEQFLVRPDYSKGMEIAFAVVCGAALAFLVYFAGAFAGAVMGGLMLVGVIGLSYFAFTQLGLLFDAIYAATVLTVVYVFGTGFFYFHAERERNQVRQAFSHYMAPALVEHLTREPGRLRLGGESRELTILFSDVRGFTVIAEGYRDNPGGLTSLMNRMLTPLTNAIIERHGTIDKYMGDAVMAFWNAPLDDEDHARHGCHAALDMLKRLQALNDERRREAAASGEAHLPLRLGIGLSTGVGVVGNMGSDLRFDYSVLGDVVNLCSRLEGLTDHYGVAIVISDATYREAGDDLAAIEIDLVRVKGREQAERIWALLGDGSLRRDASFRQFQDAFGAALAYYRAADWGAAEAAFKALEGSAATFDAQDLVACFVDRIQGLKADPPGEDWDGVWNMATK